MELAPADVMSLKARSSMYRLLARFWLREVDEHLIRLLQQQEIRECFLEAGGVLPSDDDIEELAIDFCQLFVGPKNHLPPFQSVWQTSELNGPTTTFVQEFMEVVNYDASQLPAGTMLDHLAVQLDVMGHILEQASDQIDAASKTAALEISQFFRANHLMWADELFDLASSRANTTFYRSIITMTREFFETEFATDG